MKRHKWEIPTFSFYDHDGIAAHLEAMAARGWLLEKAAFPFWRYRRIEPRRLHFAVAYFARASAFDPSPSPEQQAFQEYCTEAGWKLAASAGQLQIFYTDAEDPSPLETDAAVQVATIHRSAKRTFLPAHLLLIAEALLSPVFFLWQLRIDPVGLISSSSLLFSFSCWLVAALIAIVELFTYLRWYFRAKAAATLDGSFFRTHSHPRFQNVILAVLAVQFTAWILGSALESRRSLVFSLFAIGYVTLVFLSVHLITALLKRRGISAKVNCIVFFVSAVVMPCLLMVVMAAGVISLSGSNWLSEHTPAGTYTYHGMTWEIYHDPLPLRVEDLLDTDYDSYSYERTKHASPLLSHTEYTQRNRLGDPSQPELSYEILQTSISTVYDVCLSHLLAEADRWNTELPPAYGEA